MTALIRLSCDCGDDCSETVDIPAQSTSAARCDAKDLGWDCDVQGGTTVDWAPGHQWPAVDQDEALTEREREIATLAASGLTNRRISQRIHLTESTVEQYLTRVYRKLGCHREGLTSALSVASPVSPTQES